MLSTNYRNPREIASFASSVVEGDEFVDLEGGPGRADAARDVPRTGLSPSLEPFGSLAEHDTALVSHVRSLIASGVDPGDIGVLTATNRDALAMLTALRAAGLLLAPAAVGLDEGALERREIERRGLYVGMTRARDGLWVGSAQLGVKNELVTTDR